MTQPQLPTATAAPTGTASVFICFPSMNRPHPLMVGGSPGFLFNIESNIETYAYYLRAARELLERGWEPRYDDPSYDGPRIVKGGYIDAIFYLDRAHVTEEQAEADLEAAGFEDDFDFEVAARPVRVPAAPQAARAAERVR